MNRISTSLLLAIALGMSVVGTACAVDDEEPTNEPAEQSAEITEIDKSAAGTEQTTSPVSPTREITEHTSLVQSCESCGPLPDPWSQGPLPDPWAQGASSSGTGTGSTPAPHK